MILNTIDTSTEGYISHVRELLSGCEKYYYVVTFGCQQNEADSEKIRGMARDMGYLPAECADDADLIVVNTCAIREHAEMKALSMLGRFKSIKRKRPDLILGVCGCMAAEPHIADMLKKDFHYVTFTVEPNMLHKIPELVSRYLDIGKRTFLFGEDKGNIIEGVSAVRSSKHKAWVSIMYGCNNFCTYCIVPYVRGRERSRASADILSECEALVRSGIKEITLLGQNVNSYRSDMSFASLMENIAKIDGDFIIRFMTSHPKDTSDELISVMAKYPQKIAPYFHLPLQSGSNEILKKMNRTYTAEHFLGIVEKLRQAIPTIALSTDVIIGFPGETDDDFEATLQVLQKARFDMVYSFLYSKRVGTRAASMDGAVPQEIKNERMSRLLKMQDEISLESNRPYENKTVSVLVDSEEMRGGKRVCTGRTNTNKLVHFESDNAKIGEACLVKIERAGAFDLYGAPKIKGDNEND